MCHNKDKEVAKILQKIVIRSSKHRSRTCWYRQKLVKNCNGPGKNCDFYEISQKNPWTSWRCEYWKTSGNNYKPPRCI